jgi:histidyl-tRNA synthetase
MKRAPRGTRDILPPEVMKWQLLEEKFREICLIYNFTEIRTPIFEEAELFARSAGEESDIVKKEMYIFRDRGNRELALRPEGTAGVTRAYLEHGWHQRSQPVKFYYFGPMFRYDRPQAGRQRQFYQMGIEIFGSKDPATDTEIIKFTADFFSKLGFRDLSLHINSVGCPQCRPAFQDQLISFVRDKVSLLCRDCQQRAHVNPLRLLDCKNESCRDVLQGSPRMDTYLCPPCREHFAAVLKLLPLLGISFNVDPWLVRGLDYYTNTAFEFISHALGSQGSLGGGGRYDHLVEDCGGPPVPGVGVALGVERILLAMEKEDLWPKEEEPAGVFLAGADPNCREESLALLYRLRAEGFKVETDYLNRSLKAQMKYAHRHGFHYAVIFGKEEKLKQKVKLRDLLKGEQQELSPEELVIFLSHEQKADQFAGRG